MGDDEFEREKPKRKLSRSPTKLARDAIRITEDDAHKSNPGDKLLVLLNITDRHPFLRLETFSICGLRTKLFPMSFSVTLS